MTLQSSRRSLAFNASRASPKKKGDHSDWKGVGTVEGRRPTQPVERTSPEAPPLTGNTFYDARRNSRTRRKTMLSPRPSKGVRTVLLVLAAGLVSPSAQAQGQAAGSSTTQGETLVFKAERSHAGGQRYIRVTLKLGDDGIEWRFEEEFEREIEVPWASLRSWSCWGETYGYKLDLKVPEPRDAGGTFRLERGDLRQAEAHLLSHAGEKVEERCTW